MRKKTESSGWQTKLILAVVLVFYLLFFTSSVWLVSDLEAMEYSPIGKRCGLAGSQVTLIDWAYDPADGVMSVELDISDTGLEGRCFYQFSGVTKTWDKLEIRTVLEENGTWILRLDGVPEGFGAVSLRVTKLDERQRVKDTLRLYTNETMVRKADDLAFYDRVECYYQERIRRAISALEEEKVRTEAAIRSKQDEIEACELLIAQCRGRLYGSSREKEKIRQEIEAYEKTKLNLDLQLQSLQASAGQLEEEIETLKTEEKEKEDT